jgi:hypothetical protein
MRELTLVMPYYENPAMFAFQQQVWLEYPEDVKAHLRVIVVDDCSPNHPALPHVIDTNVEEFSLYRTGVDVRWNWIFCRNLAMSMARTEWALMTDIDHVIPPKVLRNLMTKSLDVARVYRFSRVDAPAMTPYKPHPNTWLMRVVTFDRIGGYDETFSGWYGTDGDFRRRVEQVARIEILPDTIIRYSRDTIADASTTAYTRKEPSDRENVRRIVAARGAGWRPKRMTFPYERLR